MKRNALLISGTLCVVTLTIMTCFDVGKVVLEHTHDWTLPLGCLLYIGGMFFWGYLAGKYYNKK